MIAIDFNTNEASIKLFRDLLAGADKRLLENKPIIIMGDAMFEYYRQRKYPCRYHKKLINANTERNRKRIKYVNIKQKDFISRLLG